MYKISIYKIIVPYRGFQLMNQHLEMNRTQFGEQRNWRYVYTVAGQVHPILIRISQKIKKRISAQQKTSWRGLGWQGTNTSAWVASLKLHLREYLISFTPASLDATDAPRSFLKIGTLTSKSATGNRIHLSHYKILVCLEIYFSLHLTTDFLVDINVQKLLFKHIRFSRVWSTLA